LKVQSPLTSDTEGAVVGEAIVADARGVQATGIGGTPATAGSACVCKPQYLHPRSFGCIF